MNTLKVDLDLVQKYNVAGPRYTSYPPATKFANAFKWPELAEKISANNETTRDLSLYFHIPFCETLCWFCGCTTVITTDHKKGTPYLDQSRAIALGRRLADIFATGRNPTAWPNHPQAF
jgi:oxygen-independent coproporphyrinogen-3 oxidase